LRRLPESSDRNLLVGSATADDAGVYRIDRDRALVQTVDFFTPIVDDGFLYGQIAATNSLSDVYAMGGRPLTAMNILGVPTDAVPPAVINAILRGGAAKTLEAKCTLVGGHTIQNPEPIYGLSVTGIVSPKRMLTNADARAGDLLVLTKPLGTGIITTGIKRGIAPEALVKKAVRSMRTLNDIGVELAERGLVKGATDVTGFGLLGHLGSMCRASGVGAELDADKLPVFANEVFEMISQNCIPGGTRQNLETANDFTKWLGVSDAQKVLAADAQTSGGLLLCVPPRNLNKTVALLSKFQAPCAVVIGRIIERPKGRIIVRGGGSITARAGKGRDKR
jgi:selenide,water dikinase